MLPETQWEVSTRGNVELYLSYQLHLILLSLILLFVKMEIDVFTKKRNNIKFLVKLGKNCQQITEMLRAVYVDIALKKTSVFKSVKRFKEEKWQCHTILTQYLVYK